MADTKTTGLTDLTAPVAADKMHVIDVSDTTMDPTGTDKDMTLSYLTEATAGGSYPLQPDGGTQQWVIPGATFVTTAVGISTQNVGGELVYEPWLITQRCTLTAMGVYVATLNASNDIQLGVYRADKDWQPTTLAVDAGALDQSSTGRIAITGLSTVLDPGRYLACRLPQGSFGNLLHHRMNPAQGCWFSDTYNTFIQKIYKTGQTFGALPSTGTKWDTMTTVTTETSFLHAIFARFD